MAKKPSDRTTTNESPITAAESLRGELPPAEFGLQEENPGQLEPGIALCLSGGGYRAMLFHIGSLWRLNELGLLSQLKRISSVSGGSITAAVLGVAWNELGFSKIAKPPQRADQVLFEKLVVSPIRKMASTSIDVSSVLWGGINPRSTISEEVAKKYDKVLFSGRTLQDLPDGSSACRFVINATNVKTGSLWRFSQPFMADYRVGIVDLPNVPLAQAVAASSAFPPVLSPMKMDLSPYTFKAGVPARDIAPELRKEAILTDGGVYDNLGLETVWKRYETVLISDGGRKMADDLTPGIDWASHSRRLIDLLQHQTSNLRRRTAIGAFNDPEEGHKGTYWGIQTDLSRYKATNCLNCPFDKTTAIAEIPTRLTALSAKQQEQIINWGYAVSDAAVRSFLKEYKSAAPPVSFPYKETGLG